MTGPRRILVRLPSWVGDVVMATPALRALGAGFPDAEVVVEARPFLRGIVEPLAYVGSFLADPGKGWRALSRRTRTLRGERFDLAVLLPDSQRAALAPFLARVPRRVGYARDLVRRALVTDALRPEREGRGWKPISMVERYLRVTRYLGCADQGRRMDVPVLEDARAAVAERLAAEGVDAGARLLVAVCGASYGSSKLWPAERFGAACARLAGELGLEPVLAPGPGEEEVSRAVVATAGTGRVLADPVAGLGELAALIERATLVLTNDTGPRQMAVALGIPAVVLMGPTDPRYTEHDLERQRVLRAADVECSPCGLKRCPIDHRCMTRIEVDGVVSAAAELLSTPAPA